jgi:hypothetical protein
LGYPARQTVRIPLGFTAVLIAVFVLSLMAAPLEKTFAQESNPTPQLPILLLNGAIYAGQYDAGAFPASFRVEGYEEDVTAPYLIQCEGPIKEVWVEDLRRIGGEPRGYVPYNTLLVGMDGPAASRLGELDFVSWSGIYQPYFKISPSLQLRLSQGGEVAVLVGLFSSRLLQDTLDELARLPVEVVAVGEDAWCAVVALRLPVEVMDDVASLAAVEWMELCTAGTLPAAREDSILPVEYVMGFQIEGEGREKVGLGDSGLGTGGLQGLPPLLAGSVSALYSLRGDDGADVNGHGTAVAGSMLSREAGGEGESPFPQLDIIAYATGYGLGCPPQPLSLYSMLDDAFTQGIRIFLLGSVPEGRESLGAYGIYAFQRDAFIWQNPTLMVVDAAGNEGTDADEDGSVDKGSLLGGATAKNVLSVGGCESAAIGIEDEQPLTYSELGDVFQGRFPSPPLRDDSSVGAPTGMAAFSSRGPTRDGRIKPDLVAPATAILTLASGGAESVPGIFPAASQGLVRAYGTSMAAAQAAKDLASMRRPLERVQEVESSAALLKAFLVNGAVDLAPGQYGSDEAEIPPAPNDVEGWGRIDVKAFNQTGSWMKVLDDKEGMRLDESRVFRIEVASGNELRVTLVWSDYPSLPEARLQLVNDLDLRVVGPDGGVYYPNGRDSRDPLNNVERIVLDISGSPGDYIIELDAWNVPFSPQPFALVAQVL